MSNECVSDKIAKLIGEGYEQDQAAAIAYKMCESRDAGKPYLDYREMIAGDERSGAWHLATSGQSDIAVAGTYAEIEPTWTKALAIWDRTGELDGTADIDEMYAELVSDDTRSELATGGFVSDEAVTRSIAQIEATRGVVAYRFINRAASIDTLEGVVNGYVYIYGDPEHRDAYHTWFDPARPVDLDIENGAFRRPIKYEHCQDPIIGLDTVGYIETVQPDAVGLRFEGRLDRSSPHYERIVGELQRGELFTSSATGEHTAKFRDDGSFEAWTLLELSLTRYPAESRMPGVTLIRSQAPEEAHAEPRAGDEANAPAAQPLPVETESVGEKQMTPEQLAMLQQLVAEFGADAVEAAIEQAAAPQPEAAPAPVAEVAMSAAPAADARSIFANLRATLEANKKSADVEALRSRIAALEAERNAPPSAAPITRGAQRSGEGVNLNFIPDSKTRNLSASDMWFVQQTLGTKGLPVSESFARTMIAKSVDHFQAPAKAGDEFAQNFVRSFGTKRADEIMATNIAGQGTEWVGVAYATDLWEKIRVAPVFDAFRALGMMEMSLGQGQNSIYVPTEGADPTWYSAPEANDLSSGRIEVTSNPQFVGTGRVQVTPGTLKATVAWSEELDEDSLIPMASWLNTQMGRSAAEVAEYALINGDTVTTGNTNLNLIDGTPGTGASRPAYLATNGILKLPIITTTSLSYDANNTHTEETYLEVLKKLPNEVNGDVNNVVFIIGVREHFAALNIPAFKTKDVNSQATVENGVLTRVFGRKLLMSGQIALANTAGKISATGGNNLYGRIIAAVPRYWAVVNKRDVRFKLSEDPYNDAQLLRVSFRMGATYRSTTSAAAAAYEVAV